MANGKNASERAIEILAEIDAEEKMNKISNPQEEINASKSEIKTTVKANTSSTDSELNCDKIVGEIKNLNKNDLVKGIILSEILSKPVSLRRNRRI